MTEKHAAEVLADACGGGWIADPSLVDRTRTMLRTIPHLEAERDALQAKLDRLMLEYCPEEMTPEQLATWAKHQRPVL